MALATVAKTTGKTEAGALPLIRNHDSYFFTTFKRYGAKNQAKGNENGATKSSRVDGIAV